MVMVTLNIWLHYIYTAYLCKKSYIICTGFDLLVKSMLVFIPERRVTHKKDIQNYTYSRNKKVRKMHVGIRYIKYIIFIYNILIFYYII